MPKASRLILFALAPILCNNAIAQISSSENRVCNPQYARVLVDQQVADSRSVEETDKRIKILVRSADFLWKFDEPTARQYFTEAFKVASDRFTEKGFETKSDDGGLVTILPDQRFEVIKAIAKKDAKWAKTLLEQVLKEYDKSADDRKDFDKNRELTDMIRIAIDSVKTNPELSWYLFHRAMQYPLDYYWYFTLYQVAANNWPLADQLYAELIQNYTNATPRRLLFLSAYPFFNERIFGVDKNMYGVGMPEQPRTNPALQRLFIQTFFNRVASFAANPDEFNKPDEKYHSSEAVYIVSATAEIEPIVISQFPDLIGALSTAKARGTALLNDESRKQLDERTNRNEKLNAAFEQRLKEVEEADSEGKLTDSMIASLLTWGERTETQFKKIEPWLDKIVDDKTRAEAINYFYFLRSKLAIKEKRFEDAEKFAAKVPEIEHRAILAFDIASEQLKDPNRAASVYETLNDVDKLARNADDSVAKAQVLLGLATMYEKVNHALALGELSDAIKVINHLENPDIFSAAVFRQITGKGFGFFASFSSPGYNLESTFETISKNDFELSLGNAGSLTDKYFKTLAVLAVAKNCVEKAAPLPGRKQPVKKKAQ